MFLTALSTGFLIVFLTYASIARAEMLIATIMACVFNIVNCLLIALFTFYPAIPKILLFGVLPSFASGCITAIALAWINLSFKRMPTTMLGRPSVQIFLPGFIIWVASVLAQTGFYTFFATVTVLPRYLGSPNVPTVAQGSPSQFSLGITISHCKEYDESTVRDSLPRRILRSVSSRSQLEIPKPAALRHPGADCFDNWDTSTVGAREREVVAETLRDLEKGTMSHGQNGEDLQELAFPRPPTNLSFNSNPRNSGALSPEPIRPGDMKIRLAYRDSAVRTFQSPDTADSGCVDEISDIPRKDSPPIPDYHLTPGFCFGTGGTFKGKRNS